MAIEEKGKNKANPRLQDLAAQIKQQLRLEDIIGEKIPLSRHLKARCPFHNDSNPSFSIYPPKQIWKCFGCGKKGDLIEFLHLYESRSRGEIIIDLARRLGILKGK